MTGIKYHPNEPYWVTVVRDAIAVQFQLRLDEGTYNPIRSRPVGQQHGMSGQQIEELPYWEIGVPFIFESTGMHSLPAVTSFINDMVLITIQSSCEGWSDVDHRTGQRRMAAGARFMLWFEIGMTWL